MNRPVASERGTGELATPVGDHLVDVHVELGATARHPDVQGKHVMMLTVQNLVAGLHDQLVALIVEPFAVVVGYGSCLLQNGIGGDYLTGNPNPFEAEVVVRV